MDAPTQCVIEQEVCNYGSIVDDGQALCGDKTIYRKGSESLVMDPSFLEDFFFPVGGPHLITNFYSICVRGHRGISELCIFIHLLLIHSSC